MNKTPGIKLRVLFLKQIMMEDEKVYFYNNVECMILGQAKWVAINYTKGKSSSKVDAVYMVEGRIVTNYELFPEKEMVVNNYQWD